MSKIGNGGGTAVATPPQANTEGVKNALAKAGANVAEVHERPNTLKGLLATVNVRKRFEDMLGERAGAFISSILSAVAGNKHLQACDPTSVVSAAAIAASLDLPINQSLGFAHIVPYKNVAQFQLGWRGLVQLAQRTGAYKTLHRAIVYEGQLVRADNFKGTFEFQEDRKSDKVIGYYFYFQLLNGFEKGIYWPREKCEAHGRRYSRSYDSGPWTKDFDAMALKTVLKDGLSKWGVMSTKMELANRFDQAAVKEEAGELKPEYIDTRPEQETGEVGGEPFIPAEGAQD